ncbi:hypothetical protein [Aestuariivirga sp.]|uniref:hypothetical protein n=1 Tax=Aestuariivirga sp. TaxID=2650926 RepID=UPI0039E573C6
MKKVASNYIFPEHGELGKILQQLQTVRKRARKNKYTGVVENIREAEKQIEELIASRYN